MAAQDPFPPSPHAQVPCPHCGAPNTPAQDDAPYFCSACTRIVDRRQAIPKQSGVFAPPEAEARPRPRADATPAPGSPRASQALGESTGYVSRYGTSLDRPIAPPGTRAAVGGSLGMGLLLAALAGVVASVSLGFLGEHLWKVPFVFPFAIGWAIRRALALGSGGGTPDRGIVGGILFLGIVLGAFGLTRWIEYRAVAARQSDHYQALYGRGASRTLAERVDVIAALKDRAPRDGPEAGVLHVGDRTTTVSAEQDRLTAAAAASGASGRLPADGYDLELLAAEGGTGFRGHLAHAVGSGGTTLRLLPGGRPISLPGFATLVLWVLEAGVLLVSAFSRYDD